MPSSEPADAPTQSFTAEPGATLVLQLGSAESKSCADKLSAAWWCEEAGNGQLQHETVTLPPWDRITAAANQVADAAESKDTTKPATERKSRIVPLLNKQVFWSTTFSSTPLPVRSVLTVRPVRNTVTHRNSCRHRNTQQFSARTRRTAQQQRGLLISASVCRP